MKAGFLKAMLLVAIMAVTGVAKAADFTIRATANSNENDEDYDGLVVFKNYVESASNGAIAVELFIGTQLCSKGAECLQGVAADPLMCTFPHLAVLLAFSLMFKCSTCRI